MADADKIFFIRIIMGDEVWCFAHDPKNKATKVLTGLVRHPLG
jgi:hypothetical protein